MSPTLSQGHINIIIIILSTKQGLIHHDIIMFITFELSLDTHLSLSLDFISSTDPERQNLSSVMMYSVQYSGVIFVFSESTVVVVLTKKALR